MQQYDSPLIEAQHYVLLGRTSIPTMTLSVPTSVWTLPLKIATFHTFL